MTSTGSSESEEIWKSEYFYQTWIYGTASSLVTDYERIEGLPDEAIEAAATLSLREEEQIHDVIFPKEVHSAYPARLVKMWHHPGFLQKLQETNLVKSLLNAA